MIGLNISYALIISSGIAWEYSTDGGVIWDAIVPAEEERLPNLANQVLVRALFSSRAVNNSPALIYKDVNLIGACMCVNTRANPLPGRGLQKARRIRHITPLIPMVYVHAATTCGNTRGYGIS